MAGDQDFALLKLPQLWVAPSLACVTKGANSESFWLDELKRAVRPYPIGSIVPAPLKTQGRGTHSIRAGKKRDMKERETRPINLR